ncbi:MAG: metallopeptidase family protein [Phycisphaerales bacterium]
MNRRDRERFDALVDEAVESLPPGIQELIEEIPVIVLDAPTPEMLKSLGAEGEDPLEFCGLHSGRAYTEHSFEAAGGELPPDIHLFRDGIVDLAGGWANDGVEDAVYDEIVTTLLHEIGHQFGLDEDDLDRLGYA